MPLSNKQTQQLRDIANGRFVNMNPSKLKRVMINAGASADTAQGLTTELSFGGCSAIFYDQVKRASSNPNTGKSHNSNNTISKPIRELAQKLVEKLDNNANQPQP